MTIFKRFGKKKRRKYQIKRDEKGKSARSRCFKMFEDDIPFHEIAEITSITIGTVRRYHQQWKKNPKLEQQYAYFKGLLKKTAPDRERTIELVAKICGIPKENVETILHQPHGLRRILTGKFYFPGHANADHKMYVALELAFLISDHLIKNCGSYEDVYFAFQRWMKEHKEYREEEDEAIKEENTTIQFIRRILEAETATERLGRVQPDALSEEERNALIRSGIESEMKKTEQFYWLRVGIIMAGGLTREQAREKICQDILDKGDSKVAKMFREFQDKIHPLKKDDQLPPSTPLPPASST